MSEARATILRRIRRASPRAEDDAKVLASRLETHPRGPEPGFDPPPVERFVQRLEAAAATVARVREPRDVSTAVCQYLEQNQLASRLTLAPHPRLGGIPWPETLAVNSAPLSPEDETVLSVAWGAVAETGSLVFRSGAYTPTRYNFLPDTFICLLNENDLVGHLDDVWQRLRETPPGIPRALNFVTGPSRTADVEQTLQLGAHGPRRLHVLLWTGKT